MELYKLSFFISNISHDVIMFHRQYQKRALTTGYIVGERSYRMIQLIIFLQSDVITLDSNNLP
jgi:hypothetical protein